MFINKTFQLGGAVCVLLGLILACSLPDATVDCSVPDLISALNRANRDPSPSIINLAPDCVYSLNAVDNTALFFFGGSEFNYGDNGLPQIITPITINGNRATIARKTGSPAFRFFYISDTGSLTINDLTLINGLADGTLPGGGGSVNPSSGGAIFNDGGVLEVNGSVLQNNQAIFHGGAIFSILIAKNFISNSKIYNNTAPLGGGVFVYHGGLLNISGSEISHNYATNHGGGLSLDHGAELNMTDTLVSFNHSNGHGGGIFKDGGSERLPTTIVGSTFQDNIAELSGGGIFIWRSPLTITDSSFTRNQAGNYGGGLSYQNNGNETVQISGTIFADNFALLNGGAIHFSGKLMEISGGAIQGNLASNGAGIHNGPAGDTRYIIRPDTSLTIKSSTLQGNVASGVGGGILNEGVLNCAATSLIANESTAQGGGIHNTGDLEVSGCVFENNTSGSDGGGISNQKNAFIGGSHFTDNRAARGGALFTRNGNTRVSQSTFTANSAAVGGGAVFNWSDTLASSRVNLVACEIHANTAPFGGGLASELGDTTIIDSDITANQATKKEGGGIYNNGFMSVSRSIISDNEAFTSGGGVHNQKEMNLTDCAIEGNSAQGDGGGLYTTIKAIISSSTFAGNSASRGGGLASLAGELEMVNCTVSGNTAVDAGGGIFLGRSPDSASSLVSILRASHVTIALNNAPSGGGLAFNRGVFSIKNSIVARNPTGGDCSASAAGFSSAGANLDSDASCPGFTLTKNPILAPLADNGGFTRTHALQSGSPAIDAAPDCAALGGALLSVDQRGQPRPGGAFCDLGAYEDQTALPLPALPFVEIIRVLDCRLEPSSSSPAITSFQPNDRVEVVGRNLNHTWFQVAPPGLDKLCWLWVGGVEFHGDLDSVVLIPPQGVEQDEDVAPQPCQPPPGGCPSQQAPYCWDKKKCACVPCG